MRISDWSSDVCSSDLPGRRPMPTHLDDRDALPIWQRQLAQRESRYWRDERAISTDVPEDWSQRPALLRALEITARRDRKSVVEGKSVSVRLDLGGRRLIKKKNT